MRGTLLYELTQHVVQCLLLCDARIEATFQLTDPTIKSLHSAPHEVESFVHEFLLGMHSSHVIMSIHLISHSQLSLMSCRCSPCSDTLIESATIFTTHMQPKKPSFEGKE